MTNFLFALALTASLALPSFAAAAPADDHAGCAAHAAVEDGEKEGCAHCDGSGCAECAKGCENCDGKGCAECAAKGCENCDGKGCADCAAKGCENCDGKGCAECAAKHGDKKGCACGKHASKS